jgi:signal transduction histidine kinase
MTINDYELFILLGTSLSFLLIAFIILVVVLYRRSQLKFEMEKQALHQALLQTEVEIREQTLQNISRDLHDNFGQIASLIKINLNLLSDQLSDKDQKHIAESKEHLKRLIGDIRSLSSALAHDTLAKQGLAKMIEADLQRVSRSGALKVSFNNQYQESLIDAQQSVFLYRMFQELLNNALKHAQAANFKVHLKGEDQMLSLKVKDDGIGIPKDKLHNQKHGLSGNGLLNLQERCAMIGADYILNSKEGEGTEIEIRLTANQT